MEQSSKMTDTYNTTTEDITPTFFRCKIGEGEGKAIVKIGRRKVSVDVSETSIEGFTITVPAKQSNRIQAPGPWVLIYDGTRTEVHPQWIFNSPDGSSQIALRRLRDLTKPKPVRSSLLVHFGGRRFDNANNAAIAYGGFVLLFICVLSLPGFGEKLGTAGWIQDGFRSVILSIDQIVTDTF